MRRMYDSTNPGAIPTSAQLVAGYVSPSGYAWSQANWDRFPNSIHVRITPQVSHTGVGIHVLDVENGDATPAQAPGWVKAQRGLGQDPTVYCSQSAWGTVQAAFNAQGVAQPHYWIASYPGGGSNVLPSLNGIVAVAHQWADPNGSGGDYDLSTVADFWPGVDGDTPMTPEQAQQLQDIWNQFLSSANAAYLTTVPDQFEKNVLPALVSLADQVTALAAQVTALQAQVQNQGTGTVTLVPSGSITLAPEAK